MNYLIDTDILIYSLKGREEVIEQFKAHRNFPKSMSVITYGELMYGARKSKYVEKNMANVRRLAEVFPIIHITPAIMETFGDLKTNLEKTGTTIDDMDLLIGSTAIAHNFVVVTNNTKHFEKIAGLELENWSL
ncbi:MAG TPA: type II toxin-antitoxin system VapC family toxin [Sediminispirochaeta sp.]|nr:type II toxin-antitoxin system VapC family toxin [Sediminispirochaeta sp.]